MSEASRRGTTQNAFVEDASDAIADYDGKGRKVTATTTDKHGSRLFSMPSPKVTILGLNSHQEAHLGYRSDAPTTILPRHLTVNHPDQPPFSTPSRQFLPKVAHSKKRLASSGITDIDDVVFQSASRKNRHRSDRFDSAPSAKSLLDLAGSGSKSRFVYPKPSSLASEEPATLHSSRKEAKNQGFPRFSPVREKKELVIDLVSDEMNGASSRREKFVTVRPNAIPYSLPKLSSPQPLGNSAGPSTLKTDFLLRHAASRSMSAAILSSPQLPEEPLNASTLGADYVPQSEEYREKSKELQQTSKYFGTGPTGRTMGSFVSTGERNAASKKISLLGSRDPAPFKLENPMERLSRERSIQSGKTALGACPRLPITAAVIGRKLFINDQLQLKLGFEGMLEVWEGLEDMLISLNPDAVSRINHHIGHNSAIISIVYNETFTNTNYDIMFDPLTESRLMIFKVDSERYDRANFKQFVCTEMRKKIKDVFIEPMTDYDFKHNTQLCELPANKKQVTSLKKRSIPMPEQDAESEFFTRCLRKSPTPSIINTVPQNETIQTLRTTRAAARFETTAFGFQKDHEMFSYPFHGGRGVVTVRMSDAERLNEGEFLNDTIIEFYLKYLYLQKLSSNTRKITHFFNSFFYQQLTSKVKGKVLEEAARYEKVRKWTKGTDIFSKRFIVVPINEHAHWYLAIIFNPRALIGEPSTVEVKGDEKSWEGSTLGNSNIASTTISSEDVQSGPGSAGSPMEISDGGSEPVDTSGQSMDMYEDEMIRSDSQPLNGAGNCVVDSNSAKGLKMAIKDDDSEVIHISDTEEEESKEFQLTTASIFNVEDDIVQFSGSTAVSEAVVRSGTAVASETTAVISETHVKTTGEVFGKSISSGEILDFAESLVKDDDSDGVCRVSRARKHILDDDDEYEIVKVNMKPEVEDTSGEEPKLRTFGERQKKRKGGRASKKRKSLDVMTDPEKIEYIAKTKLLLEQPWIFVFDSLDGRHSPVSTNLNMYLRAEARDKLGKDVLKGKKAQVIYAKVPRQPNHCDCGVFLMQYVETFLGNPDKYLPLLVNKEDHPQEWFKGSLIKNKRSEIKKLSEDISLQFSLWKSTQGSPKGGSESKSVTPPP